MPFDFYFAGSQCVEATQTMIDLNANVLKSYINEKKQILEWFERRKNGWQGKLLIDNGAFTVHRKGGEIDIDEYINWLNDNDEFIDRAIALDNIPGKWGRKRTYAELKNSPAQTWQNYLYMTERCKSPQKLLPVFHQGEDFKYLEQMVNHKIGDNYVEYICISGNKELTNKQREIWYTKCFEIIQNSGNPNVKVHCLGSATESNAVRFPFTSMDATSWIMTGANGGILTDFGVVKVSKESAKDKDNIKNCSKDVVNFVTNQCKKYGITLEQIQNDYKYRMVMNVHYLYDMSQRTTYNEKKVKTNKLF